MAKTSTASTYYYHVSNDGTNWGSALLTVGGGPCLNGGTTTWCYHDVSTTSSFRYHRIQFTNPAGSRLYVYEVELYGYFTAAPAPSAPVNVAASQVASNTVKVTFDPPTSGTPTSYTVTCAGSAGATTRSITTASTTVYVTNLTPLGTYNCDARATNFAGGTTSSGVGVTLQASDVVARMLTSKRDTNGVLYYVGTNNGTTPFSNPCASSAILLTSTAGSSSNKCENTDRYFGGVISSRSASSHTLLIGLPAGTALLPTEYTVTGLNVSSAMDDWVLEGSNNLSTWDVLHTAANQTCLSSTCSYQLDPTNNFYRYYRLVFTADGSRNRMYTNEIEFYGLYHTNY
jgi:hypothetical protein